MEEVKIVKIRGESMLRKIQYLSVVFSVVVFAVIFAGSLQAAPSNEGLLVSPQLLDRVGLEMGWQVNLPMKGTERTADVYSFGKYLYVLSSKNYVYCIDKEKQAFRFGLQLAVRGLPVSKPLYYDDKLWFMVGSELIVLDPKTGAISKKKRLKTVGRSVAGGLARNKDHLYIPGSDKRLHAISVDGFWQKFMVATEGGSQITSAVANDDFVVFATERGKVMRIMSAEPKRRWQYDVLGQITAPLVMDGEWVYVSGKNAKLCKLGVNRGRAAWDDSFHAGVPLKKSVVAGKDVVYQPAGKKGLYAVDKETGEAVWHAEAGVDILAEIGTKAYVYAKPGVLVAMDNKSGKQLYSVNFSDVSKYAVNATEKLMYVADNGGRVMCIGEKK
jgi:outer membrane protein assembly factor BamB